MGADDGGIDHLDAAMPCAGLVQRLQHHLPGPRQRPAPELPIDRVPLAEMAVQVTPGRACPSDPEHSVQHPSVITRTPPPSRPLLDNERLEERPFLVRHQTTNQRHSPQRAALNQSSGDLGIHFVHTT